MSVSGIGSADHVQRNEPNTNTQSIDQKIRELKDQMKKVKENKKLSPEEKEKRIKNLEQQIKKLEEQKHKMKKKESEAEDPTKNNTANGPGEEGKGDYIDIQA